MSSAQERRRMRLISFRPYRNAAGTMLGFLSAELPSGMVIHSMKLMVGPGGKHWVAMPAERAFDKGGNAMIEAKGRQIWNSYVDFANRAAREKCQRHPEVFEGSGTQ